MISAKMIKKGSKHSKARDEKMISKIRLEVGILYLGNMVLFLVNEA